MHVRRYRGPVLFGFSLATALTVMLGASGVGLIGASAAPAAATVLTGPRIFAPLTGPVKAIEIDELSQPFAAGVISGNANFTVSHTTTIPHTGNNCPNGGTSGDNDCPVTSVSADNAFGDWNTLDPTGGNLAALQAHEVTDAVGNSDQTEFAGGSCLTAGSVLPKEDAAEAFAASNQEYFYFGETRLGNNGNSQFYWNLTTSPAQTVPPTSGCNKGVIYQMQWSKGDIQINITFPSTAGQITGNAVTVTRYTSNTPSGYLDAKDAVNDPINNPSRWVDDSALVVKQYAINTSPITQPLGGTNAALARGTTLIDTAEFSEGALGLNEFLGGSTCGKTFNTSIITKPSSSASSDLKDLLGPFQLSFGGISGQIQLTGSCSLTLGYSASATDNNGTAIPSSDFTTSWNCTDNGSALALSGNSGSTTLARGNGSPHNIDCTATVTQTSTSCQATAAEQTTTVYAPLQVSIAPNVTSRSCTVPTQSPLPVGQGGFDAGDIGSGVTYSPTISGGSGTNDLTWNVSPSGDAVSGTCGSNTNCTALPPDNHYCSLTDLSLHVADHDAATSQCPAVDSEHEQVTKTTSVSATNH